MDTKNIINAEPSWAGNDMAFKAIKPGSLGFERLTRETSGRGLQNQPATLLYDALALRYNQAEPGDLLMVSLPNRPTSSNLRKIIEARGLKESDYHLFRPRFDERGQHLPIDKRPLVLQRITDKEMRTIQPYTATAAQMAKEAEQRGGSHDFSQPENPAIPGPAEEISAKNQVLANT